MSPHFRHMVKCMWHKLSLFGHYLRVHISVTQSGECSYQWIYWYTKIFPVWALTNSNFLYFWSGAILDPPRESGHHHPLGSASGGRCPAPQKPTGRTLHTDHHGRQCSVSQTLHHGRPPACQCTRKHGMWCYDYM